jgi:vacuolar-type H+-ATPase subunit E/Vma4
MQKLYNLLSNNNSESWTCFNQLRDFWRSEVEVLEEFSVFIKEKAEVDRIYAKSLEKLSKSVIFEKAFGRFGLMMNEYRTSLQEISSTLIGHCDFVDEELYSKVKSTIKEHESAIKEIREKTKQLISEREKFLKRTETSKTRYLRSSKDQEAMNLLKIESPQNAYHREYITASENLLNFDVIYKCELADPIRNFKSKIEEKFKLTKNSLQSLISSEASWIYPVKMHIDSLAISVEKLSFEEELNYIEGMIQQFLDIGLPDYKDLDLEEKISEPPEIEKKLLKIIENCWDGQKITEENLEFVKRNSKEEPFRKTFIKALNDKRRLQLFLVPNSSFDDLVFIFNSLLDSCKENQDFNLVRQCIILSETFYIKGKICVQNFIKTNNLWNDEKFWVNFIDDSVCIAIYNEGNQMEAHESLEEVNQRSKDITKSTLIWYIQVMLFLARSPDFIKKIFNSWKEMGMINDSDFEII